MGAINGNGGTLMGTGTTGPVSMFSGSLSPGAVSYTHLRAHETVLDLVCRLLLEKKKQSNLVLHHHHQTRNIHMMSVLYYILLAHIHTDTSPR